MQCAVLLRVCVGLAHQQAPAATRRAHRHDTTPGVLLATALVHRLAMHRFYLLLRASSSPRCHLRRPATWSCRRQREQVPRRRDAVKTNLKLLVDECSSVAPGSHRDSRMAVRGWASATTDLQRSAAPRDHQWVVAARGLARFAPTSGSSPPGRHPWPHQTMRPALLRLHSSPSWRSGCYRARCRRFQQLGSASQLLGTMSEKSQAPHSRLVGAA